MTETTTTRPPTLAAGERNREHGHGDQSRRDFAVACRLIEAGREDEEIMRAIQAARLDAKAQRRDYLERTVRAARAHIGRKKC